MHILGGFLFLILIESGAAVAEEEGAEDRAVLQGFHCDYVMFVFAFIFDAQLYSCTVHSTMKCHKMKTHLLLPQPLRCTEPLWLQRRLQICHQENQERQSTRNNSAIIVRTI